MTATTRYEIGSLVEARGREWVVLPESQPVGVAGGPGDAQFLVLRPLGGSEDERAGVLTSLEQVREATFPAPVPADAGNADRARLLRTALRVGFTATGGPFRSLARIGVEPRPYQLVPLLLALRQDVVRMLVADDVGIGKTIEAGLIAAELLAQGDARGLAVLCPPALAEQWQGELAGKFGIHTELVLPGTITRLERGLLTSETLFDRYPHLVISTDYIKQDKQRAQFLTGCPDLVIVDEAHACVVDDANTGSSRMLRHELMTRLAADPARHLLLLTATPHSGKDDGFRNLLGLLDPELATLDLEQPAGRDRLARHLVQRRRADIRRYLDAYTPFPEDRQTSERPYRLSGGYRELFDDVLHHVRRTVRDPDTSEVRQRVRYWSALALLRALASSPRAAAATLRTRAGNADAASPEEADALGRAAVLDLPDDETYESADVAPGAEVEEAGSPEGRRLRAFANRADALEDSGDRKLELVTGTVKELLADGFNPIVFCRFVDTAEYVAEHLGRVLRDTAAVAAVTGALHPEERARRVAELAGGSARPVLVATDCLSEGVNLQEGFQAVVHYDLAWNPTRHEQREGRVDRFGQRAPKVRAVTLYGGDNRIDGIVLQVLLRKHEQIRKALGYSVPVPDRSNDVMQAILEGLLIREVEPAQEALFELAPERREELHRQWDSSVAAEKQSQTKYAQRGIQPAEVATELAEVRASLGAPEEIVSFTREALAALGGDVVDTVDGFTATTGLLPLGLRAALPAGHRSPLPFHRDLPVQPREAYLDRTDPAVAATARYVLESALDTEEGGPPPVASRCGVMRTSAVEKRTTLLLVRYRMHLTLPGRDEVRRSVAEEARVLGFRGAATNPEWLDEPRVEELLSAVPTGNVPPDQAEPMLERAIEGLDVVMPSVDATADELAARLRESHLRVREAAGQRARRQITVTAQKPADVLGVYVFLPEVTR
jgi:superfamily II DNA or RNA helicase